MSGSKRWFRYVGDGAVNYAVELDNTNSIAVVTPPGGGAGVVIGTVIAGGEILKPGRLRMRYANTYNQTLPVVKRRFWILSQTAYNAIVPGSTIVTAGGPAEINGPWVVTSTRGEKRSIPTTADTGQTV